MINIYQLGNMDSQVLERIKTRARADIDAIRSDVEEIISDVKSNGDEALVRLTRKWDDPNFGLDRLTVSEADIEQAYEHTDENTIEAIRGEIGRCQTFYQQQNKQIVDWQCQLDDGIIGGEKWTTVASAGLYIPGGKNPFPSVQAMLAIPAKVAGVKRLVSCISPGEDTGAVIVAAAECGVKEIYRVGGAQAIAALAYGTKTIKPVDIVTGPGNPYVTAAKTLCQVKVAIDMPAGPSEVLIIADDSLREGLDLHDKARFCAADILAQAEHGSDSAVVLVTDSRELADLVAIEVEIQFNLLSRVKYMAEAIESYGGIILVDNLDQAIDFANEYAAEHLEIMTADPEKTFEKIVNAGSVFLGCYCAVAAGDYAIGVNHTIPASGWAKQYSPMSVWTYKKRVQYSSVTKQGLNKLRPIISALAKAEGLDAHGRSVEIRFDPQSQSLEPALTQEIGGTS